MINKTATVLAITLAMASLSAARAEDPDENVSTRFHAAASPWPAESAPHAVPFSEARRPRHTG